MQKIQSGFTVVEIIVAITVASLIAIGLSIMTSNLNALSDRAGDLVAANSVAENKFEDLRSSTFLGLVDGTYDFESELPDTLAAPRTASYTIADSTLPNISTAVKEVDITITFDSHGKTETLEYSGFIGELGVGQY